MINLLNKKVLEWIHKHKLTFLLIALLGANVYQFVHSSQERKEFRQQVEETNIRLEKANQESIKYERERAESLEKLLDELVRKYNQIEKQSKKK